MNPSQIRPQIGLVPVIGIAVGELRAPALHQADRGDDDDASCQFEQPAPFAGARKPERKSRYCKPAMRSRLPESVDKCGDPKQAERQRKNIQHRNPRLHVQHLVKQRDQRRGDRRLLRSKQRETAAIHRNDRKRSKQHARVAPADGIIAEHPDRERDQLFCQRWMHRIEHRRRRYGFKHLPRGRHIMHFVEIKFVRRGDADQKRDMRGEKQDHRDKRCRKWLRTNRRYSQWGHMKDVATVECGRTRIYANTLNQLVCCRLL